MANKAIFLDRDDTLIEDPGYISGPEQVKLLDGVPEALIEFGAMGYKLIVVSNQSGVARGIVTEKALDEIHDRLKRLLAEKGAHLDGIYYCPYHPEGLVRKYRKESEDRKPNPGMLLTAADQMDIDLIMTGQPKSVRDRLQIILSTLMEMERETGIVERLALTNELDIKYSISRREAEHLIGQLLREGTIYEPREGYLKKT